MAKVIKTGTQLKFDVEASIKYLEFWKPIDGSQKMMTIWHLMGADNIVKVITKLGYNPSKVDTGTAINIIKKSFGKAGIEKTRDVLLEVLRNQEGSK